MKYNHVIGVGGIGTGLLFLLDGDHTLGRDESRAGYLSNARDFCKGHITMHYLSMLAGCRCTLLGLVGDDMPGKELIEDMSKSGIDIRYIKSTKEVPTMMSICFEYPDHSGGNITASNSASSLVNDQYIMDCLKDENLSEKTIILAVPEVPLIARIALLNQGKKFNAMTASSFSSAEIGNMINLNLLKYVDILAVNRDEASMISSQNNYTNYTIAKSCYEIIKKINPDIQLIVTVGSEGAYLFDRHDVLHVPPLDVPVISTAGAGDAFLSGLLSGMSRGLSFFQSSVIGNIVAGFAVMSQDTIARDVNVNRILSYIKDNNYGKEIEYAL